MDLNLNDRVVVVTGGASGIGLATANLLAEESARPILLDLAQPPAETNHPTLKADITDAAQLKRAFDQIETEHGPIEGLVHAAAIGSGQFGFPFTHVDAEAWQRVLQVNVMGMTHVALEVAPRMVAQRSGAMVFVASISGQIGSQTDPPYSASKAANINFAQCIAKDVAASGVRVNSVCPGMVQTPLNRSVWQAWNDRQAEPDKRSYEDWAGEKVRSQVPLRRWQTTRDIANTIVFLLSDRASEITGQTINIDGGFVMHW